MPFADIEKKRAYFRAYKARKRAEQTKSPTVLRDGQWASGHSDLARCLTCGKPITSAPRECTEPKHAQHHQRRTDANNKYRREQRAAARAVGEVKRYGTPEAKKRQSKAAYQKRRQAILEKMGGACEACQHTDHRALQVHHKDGGGGSERQQKGWRYHLDMARMTASELRSAFRLLCANCHQVEHYEAGQNPVEQGKGFQPPGI